MITNILIAVFIFLFWESLLIIAVLAVCFSIDGIIWIVDQFKEIIRIIFNRERNDDDG